QAATQREVTRLNTTGDAYSNMESEANAATDPYITFWHATARDAAGRLASSVAGNGLETQWSYNPATGQLLYINSGFGFASPTRQLEYHYDPLNNVESRIDHIQGLSEDFSYDRLNRLTQNRVTGQIGQISYDSTTDYSYDSQGNMLDNSGIGDYTYGDLQRSQGNAGPHALLSAGTTHSGYNYDENGNMLSGAGRQIEWSSFNKPTRFTRDAFDVRFVYGPDRDRYLKITQESRTLYLDKTYEKVVKGSEVKHKHFIYADGELVSIHVKTSHDGTTAPDETRYLHRDALGSIDTITDGQGNVVDRMSYEPFGKRRGGDWRTDQEIIIPALTNRGFTGHEHVDEMDLIHMNGRVYDPELGRFLSADPYIQALFSSQSFNRYAYVWNNPLRYWDPSGYWKDGSGNAVTDGS
ncbi:MAG: RHS repeat-associated core domain-containing protein, partial [Gammaproteobacteria bacterium]|nr:RHS repeat-associated core domain-containing protein [Gammaproteobacteria bacterium]